MRNKIEYSGHTFTTSDIKSVNIRLASSLISRQLEANSITAVVETDNESIQHFVRNTPMLYYYQDRQRFLAYVQSVDRIGLKSYQIYGTSAIGLLIDRLHTGGIYTGQTAEKIIQEIVGSTPFSIKNNLKSVKLYGWLPYAKPPNKSARDNLTQVLFALGATIKTDLNGILHIEPLWDGVSGSIPWDQIYNGATVKYDSEVSSVSVTEHHYMIGGEETKLFEGDTISGDIITFSEPMYNLVATGFSILESGANYAKLSTGNGTLTGRKYIHNTRQISKIVTQNVPENVKNIDDATLISLVNSNATADRMVDYYKHLERINCDVVLNKQSPGDVLAVYHPYNKTDGPACAESMDISASNIMKARITALVGYKPKQVIQTVIFDQHQVVTTSRTITLPDGVTNLRVVLIGGGFGGSGGTKGTNGTNGSGASSSPGDRFANIGAPGKGGAGGNGGSGGGGGKIATFAITGIVKTISISIGSGGSGGTAEGVSGASGGATTIRVNGITYSSNSGASSASGYQDLVTGIVYGRRGVNGSVGAAGGDGGGRGDDDNVPTIGNPGKNAGSNKGGSGGTGWNRSDYYRVSVGHGGGGGGAAYSAPGGNGNSSNGGGGASGTRPTAATNPGSGGTGGSGGGGGGGGGGTVAFAGSQATQGISASGGIGGQGGRGGPGGNGAPGCVILYYGIETKAPSGSPIDKNKKLILDNFGRILVT